MPETALEGDGSTVAVRTARINVNTNVNPPITQGEPRDLHQGTAFGGTVDDSNPSVQNVVASTRNTGSCGSCHLGEAAGKAGSVLNFNVGGEDVYRLTNTSDSVVDTHLLVIVRGLPAGARLKNKSGTTHSGDPYIRVFLPDGVLRQGQRITLRLVFSGGGGSRRPAYGITLLSGQGVP